MNKKQAEKAYLKAGKATALAYAAEDKAMDNYRKAVETTVKAEIAYEEVGKVLEGFLEEKAT